MVKNISKVILGIVTTLFLCIYMVACNTQGYEPQGENKNKRKITEIITVDPDAPAEADKKEVLSTNISKVGEEVSEIDVQNDEAIPDALIYMVNKVTLFNDISEAGIDRDEMPSFLEGLQGVLDENGEIKSSVKFLLVELTVKNVRALPDRNISSFDLLCADSSKEISKKISEIDFFELPPPDYFSNPSGKEVGDDWREYYYYSLPVGQSKDLKVGWHVDSGEFDLSNLYLVFNRYNDKYEQFVKLDF